jgi:hypothetical protein
MSDAPATDREKLGAFNRAKSLLDKINPILTNADVHDVFLALQLLFAKYAVSTRLDLPVLLTVLAQNLPAMMTIWEKAEIDAQAAHDNIFAAPGSQHPPGRTRGRG